LPSQPDDAQQPGAHDEPVHTLRYDHHETERTASHPAPTSTPVRMTPPKRTQRQTAAHHGGTVRRRKTNLTGMKGIKGIKTKNMIFVFIQQGLAVVLPLSPASPSSLLNKDFDKPI